MEGKTAKNGSSSTKPEAQQSEKSPQRVDTSTESPPPARVLGPPPSPSQGSHSSGGSLGGVGGLHSVNMHAITVGGGADSVAGGAGGLVIEAAGRKRAREVGEVLGVGAGGDQLPFQCTVCRKSFPTNKSLFGHMRTHSSRGWKGAFPPPMFSREEFADTGLLNPEGGDEGQGEQEAQQVAQEATPAIEEEAAVGVQEAIDLNATHPQAPEGGVQFHLPDLNRSPPEEGNGNGNGNGNGKH